MNKVERQAQKERCLTAERLREKFHYSNETGVFTHRIGARSRKIAGRLSGAGYRQLIIDGRYYYAHRLAWLYVTGKWPKLQIDHIDLDKTNNRFENLREANRIQNQGNRTRNANNKVGAKGVRWNRSARRWQARITSAGKDIHLGYFDSIADAKEAYRQAANQKFGKYARTA